MKHYGCIYLRIFKQTILDHILRAVKNLLSRLKFNLYSTAELILVRF